MITLSSGETSPETEASAKVMGLEVLYMPSSANLDDGMVGVAPLGESCIVLFYDIGRSK
jgi:hypothetical protein